ncbi:hypothetical protein I4U23_003823 [Adineta vaga]|nr:hypothetical protein I4U23_003823 [Adineta vaga]
MDHYLSSRHIWRAFFGINKSLNQLLTSNLIRHTIDLKGASYSEIVQLLENHDKDSQDHQWQVEFSSHAHAICFENDFDYEILINRWIATKINWKLPLLRAIYILPEAVKKVGILFSELKFAIILQSQLQYLHLVFHESHSTYHYVLSALVKERISCSVMILEVTKENSYPHFEHEDLYDIKYPLCWIRTVCLTISLQHSSELILLLMPEALPLLEHLNVTIEQPREDLLIKREQSIKSIQLSENDLRHTNAVETKLRSLVLHQIELKDLLTLFNSFTFPLLSTLILVDIFDRLGPTNLPSLKRDQFQFLLRFPAKYEREWIQGYYKYEWPFNNVGFHVDERIFRPCSYESPLEFFEDVFYIYSIPFDVLKYMPLLIKTWNGCNQIGSLISPTRTNLCHHLRSLTFRFTRILHIGSTYHSILQLILDASPHLFYLNTPWRDLSVCLGRYPMIKHVHLNIGGDDVCFDVAQFNIIIPNVQYLSFRRQHLIKGKEMVNFVNDLLINQTHFHDLILLQINKNGNVTLRPNVKENIKQAIITKIDRLKNLTMTQIQFSYHNQLSIWLC